MTKATAIRRKRRLQVTVSDIGPNDVLLGRGAGPNSSRGNITFRQIVADHKQAYMATTNRKIKNQIARQTIRTIKANKGRFLEKMMKANEDANEDDFYTLADDKVVVEKTKQALRQLDKPKQCRTSCTSNISMESCNGPKNQTGSLVKMHNQAVPSAAAAASHEDNKSSIVSILTQCSDSLASRCHSSPISSVLEYQRCLALINNNATGQTRRPDNVATLLTIHNRFQRHPFLAPSFFNNNAAAGIALQYRKSFPLMKKSPL